MRLSALLLAPVALLGLTFSAQAASLNFNVVGGSLTPSGSFSGSFSIDSVTEIITAGSFTVLAPAVSPTTYTFSATAPTTTTVGGTLTMTDASGDIFRFNLNGPITNLQINLFGPAPGDFSGSTALLFPGDGGYFAIGGTVVPQTVTAGTPEPSSLILLGTGALGVAGSLRRRFATR